ncbi:MAG: HPF/RaiA family ribosome-associated protein, partial [Bryobacteraceae bacterium]
APKARTAHPIHSSGLPRRHAKMKISYTGKMAKLDATQEKKLDGRFAKLAKLLDRRGEKDVRIVLTTERHLTHAEITVNWYDHPMVCKGSDGDTFTAVTKAVELLEKQFLKLQAKLRDSKRISSKEKTVPTAATAAAELPEEEPERKIFRVNQNSKRKPMTIDEAVLEMDKDRDYMVYRDAETDRVSVLLRRRDGHFVLVEA